MKRIMTLALVISLVLSPVALFAKERQGAQLVITKTDRTKIECELIAVKKDLILILKSLSVMGEFIEVADVKFIKIVKGSNEIGGLFLGLLVGGATGAAIGYSIGYNVPEQNSLGKILRDYTGAIGAGKGAAIGVLAGGLLGAVIGSSIHNDETFQIEGKSQEQIHAVLEKLRTQARFPDYQ